MRKDDSAVVASCDSHTVFEGFEIELLQEGSFRGFDFLSDGADFEVLGDLDLTLDDLGGDVQGVEEVDLGWVQTGGTGWD